MFDFVWYVRKKGRDKVERRRAWKQAICNAQPPSSGRITCTNSPIASPQVRQACSAQPENGPKFASREKRGFLKPEPGKLRPLGHLTMGFKGR